MLVNSDIEESLAALQAILKAERLRRHRQAGLTKFVPALVSASRGEASTPRGKS